MALGPIEIQILADLAGLRRDMDQAKGVVGTGMAHMQDAASKVKAAFGALGVGLSVAGITAFVKQGIDAADMANALAQKTGLATREIAGIQLAFKQGGVSSEAMGSAMAKMSRQMVEGNSAFEQLGVKTKNADGTLRGVKDVLYDTADAFQGMQSGAARTDMAMELFGKTGADLIPTLIGGSEGLREMADMADKLGLTIDQDTGEAADKFNDTIELLGMGTQGVATQIAAKLLPTLTSLSASFLDSMTKGDALKKTADFLAAGLKTLYTAGVAIVEIFNSVGKTIGAAGAQIVAIMRGDFKGAFEIGKAYSEDMRKSWSSTADTIARAWDESGNDTVQSMAQVLKAGKEVARQTDDQKRAVKEAAAEAKKAAKDREQYTKDMLRAEAEQEKARKQWADAEAARELKRMAQYDRAQEAVDQSIEKADEMVAAIQRETAALGMSNAEREISNALLALEKTGIEQGTYAWDVYAEKVRAAVLDKQAVAESIQHSKEIADNWNALTKEIGQGLTDSLFRAFESGKSFFKTLWDGIVNTFKTTVLRLVINAVMSPINSAIGGLLGGGSTLANAATGLPGALDGLGSLFGGGGILAGLGGALGTFGTAAGYGASALFGGTGLTALSSAGSMIGAGSLAGGLGMAAGVLGPVAAGAAGLYALYKAFGHEATPHTGGAVTATGSGDITNVGKAWRNITTSNEATQSMAGLAGDLAPLLQTLAQIGSGGNISVGAGFADDKSKDKAWGAFNVTRDGASLFQLGSGGLLGGHRKFADGSQGLGDYMTAVGSGALGAAKELGLPAWAQKMLNALPSSATLEQFASVVQQIAAEDEKRNAPEESDLDLADVPSAEVSKIEEAVESMGSKLAEALEKIRSETNASLRSIAASTAATTRQLAAWDDGGAISTTPAT